MREFDNKKDGRQWSPRARLLATAVSIGVLAGCANAQPPEAPLAATTTEAPRPNPGDNLDYATYPEIHKLFGDLATKATDAAKAARKSEGKLSVEQDDPGRVGLARLTGPREGFAIILDFVDDGQENLDASRLSTLTLSKKTPDGTLAALTIHTQDSNQHGRVYTIAEQLNQSGKDPSVIDYDPIYQSVPNTEYLGADPNSIPLDDQAFSHVSKLLNLVLTQAIG